MKPQIRTTAALVGAAGTFVAVAMLLDRTSTASNTRTSTAPTKSDPPKATCGVAGDAKAKATLGLATLSAGMSKAKVLRGSTEQVHAAFEITTLTVNDSQRPPLNLALVIDRSGSMSGRIQHAQAAAIGIVDRLGAQDRVSLVQYDDSANVLVPSIATDAAGKERLRTAIHSIHLGGGTNLHGGLELGRDEVQKELKQAQVSRVILLSDGQANVGVVDPQAIAGTARSAANQGVRITTVGVGDDYNEDLMEAIAEAGRGQYHYVKNSSDLEKVIAGELSGIQGTIATNVELHLKAPCAGVEIAQVLGYESRRDGDTVIVPMADLFGGDSRKLLVSLNIADKGAGKIGALWGELVFRDAKGGELKRTAISLGVDRTDDTQIALDSADKDVMAQVIQLDAAQSMRDAAKAYEAGDQAGALRKLEDSRREIQHKADAYKIAPTASSAVLGELDGMSSGARAYSPGSTESKGMLKASKQKARVMSKSAR